MRKIAIFSMLLAFIIFGAFSCAKVSQEEYDRLKGELSALQGQLATMQAKLVDAQLLQTQNETLGKQYAALKSDFDALQADYEELNNKYEAMSEQYEKLLKAATEAEAAAEFSKEDVEQAIFKLINEERTGKGVTELEWGVNLYKWALENSRNMATYKRYEYSSYASWQEIHWAAGHNSAEGVANSAMIVWRDSLQYDRNIVNSVAIYGAVGVYQEAGIYYITYITSPFR